MRFHLIDKLCRYNKWKEADAIKNVTLGDEHFINQQNYMDDALMLESVFQCAAWLIVISSEQKYRPTIVTVEKFHVYEHVSVGEQLKIHIEITDHYEEYVVIKGTIYCAGKLCASLDNAILMLMDTERLEDKSLTEKYINYLVS